MRYEPKKTPWGPGAPLKADRCVEAVSDGPRSYSWHQCHKPRKPDSEGSDHGKPGEVCAIHDPAARRARDEKARRKLDNKAEAERLARISYGLREATLEQLKAEIARRKK